MFRAASLLIVMAFAASPTAKVVCDLTCLTESTSDLSSCHDAAHHDGGPAVKALPEACDRVAALAPFVTQGTYKVIPATLKAVMPAVGTTAAPERHRRVPSVCVDTGLAPTRAITVLRI